MIWKKKRMKNQIKPKAIKSVAQVQVHFDVLQSMTNLRSMAVQKKCSKKARMYCSFLRKYAVFYINVKKKARSPNHTKSTPCMFRPQCFPGPAESVCFKGISLNLRYPIRLCLSTGHSGKIQRACCQKVPPCPQAGSGAAEVLHAGWVPGPHYPKCPPVEPISSRLSTTSASAAASTFSSSRMALVLLVSGTTSVFHWLKDV